MLAKIGFDTAKNEPAKNWQNFTRGQHGSASAIIPLRFLKDSYVYLPEEVITKLWNHLNEGEPNPGLVPLPKIVEVRCLAQDI